MQRVLTVKSASAYLLSVNLVVVHCTRGNLNLGKHDELMLDNNSVAILTKINELAERHGVRPCAFVATINTNANLDTVLTFESPATDNSGIMRGYAKMLDALGLTASTHQLIGSDEEIFAAIEAALRLIPKSRAR